MYEHGMMLPLTPQRVGIVHKQWRECGFSVLVLTLSTPNPAWVRHGICIFERPSPLAHKNKATHIFNARESISVMIFKPWQGNHQCHQKAPPLQDFHQVLCRYPITCLRICFSSFWASFLVVWVGTLPGLSEGRVIECMRGYPGLGRNSVGFLMV
jgi:hypothetical protein